MLIPFPGMDPYLENPLHWRGVHHEIISGCAASLNARLPEGYFARIDARVYIVEPPQSLFPHVSVLRRVESAQGTSGAVATLIPSTSPIVVTAFPEEISESFIEIRRAGDDGALVTVIEVLSPANKDSGGAGTQSYRDKQRSLLHSDVNLLEIDLLRTGLHSVAAPRDLLPVSPKWDYVTCLHRPRNRWRFECFVTSIRQPIPPVCVPLAHSDEDVRVDLQAVVAQCYDFGRYADQLDYAIPPYPPLSQEDEDWADALLREKGLRA